MNLEPLINLHHVWLLLTPDIRFITVKLIMVSGVLGRSELSVFEFIDDLTAFAQSFHHILFFPTDVTLCRNQILVSLLQHKYS